MTTVLLRAAGPMQSWGTRSRFSYRDTETAPTKSGIVGLVGAALGRLRTDSFADLAAMRMIVRIDAEGQLETDFQTALEVRKAHGGSGVTVLSYRQFLADARFMVAMEGEADLCGAIHAALRSPRWPLFLGRKGYVPGEPVWVPGGLLEGDARVALRVCEWPMADGQPAVSCPIVVECDAGEEGDMRLDVPIDFGILSRRYGARRVRREVLVRAVSSEEGAA